MLLSQRSSKNDGTIKELIQPKLKMKSEVIIMTKATKKSKPTVRSAGQRKPPKNNDRFMVKAGDIEITPPPNYKGPVSSAADRTPSKPKRLVKKLIAK